VEPFPLFSVVVEVANARGPKLGVQVELVVIVTLALLLGACITGVVMSRWYGGRVRELARRTKFVETLLLRERSRG
jgi:hypothetical protein